MKPFYKYHLPIIIFCSAIFVESSFPGDYYPTVEFELSDKIVHFIIYFVLFFGFYLSFKNQIKSVLLKKYSLLASVIFTAIYGASDELHQYFVPGRTCDFYDWVADFLGAVFALLIILLYKKFIIDKKK